MVKQVNTIKEVKKVLSDHVIKFTPMSMYGFKTDTVKKDDGTYYTKFGCTKRPVLMRWADWEKIYPDMKGLYHFEAIVDPEKMIYVRDEAFHQYFLEHGIEHLEDDVFRTLKSVISYHNRHKKWPYRSDEFYMLDIPEEGLPTIVKEAWEDIKREYKKDSGHSKYSFFTPEGLSMTKHFKRGEVWKLRKNQDDVVKKFKKARRNHKDNLLMYAVMRFGKSITALSCAAAELERLKIKAGKVLILSAKPGSVKEEWQKNTEVPGQFKNWEYITSKDLKAQPTILNDLNKQGKHVVLFLSLQEIFSQGKKAKSDSLKIDSWWKNVFTNRFDITLIDETHFGVRSMEYGKILAESTNLEEDSVDLDLDTANKRIDAIGLKTGCKLHLSGTPYRVLMTNEFDEDSIISFVQYKDVLEAKDKWDRENPMKPAYKNPYYGFSKMLFFAFTPNTESLKALAELKKAGYSSTFADLFLTKSNDPDVKGFDEFPERNKKAVTAWLKAIDGTKNDQHLFPFLNNKILREGNLCKHINIILPRCASCDGLKKLINQLVKEKKLTRLAEYKILNFAGHNNDFKTTADYREELIKCANAGQKTITLTDVRGTTGTTFEPLDTTVYIKNTKSAEEYYQTIFRTQSPYTVEEKCVNPKTGKEEIGKVDLKPNTMVVDFDIHRTFEMVADIAALITTHKDKQGGTRPLGNNIAEELKIAPVFMVDSNLNKLREVKTEDIVSHIIDYNSKHSSLGDAVMEIPSDSSLSGDKIIRAYYDLIDGVDIKKGEFSLKASAYDADKKVALEGIKKDIKKLDKKKIAKKVDVTDDEKDDYKEKERAFFIKLLLFTYLTDSPKEIISLGRIIWALYHPTKNDERLIKNIGLEPDIVKYFYNVYYHGFKTRLDSQIEITYRLAHDKTLTSEEKAERSSKQFPKLSESEIITPQETCDQMIGYINNFASEIKKGAEFLDIASKQGEYAYAAVRKLRAKKVPLKDYKDRIWAIPTSPLAYEFTRRTYEDLGLNVNHIATNFTSFDLLEVKDKKGKIDYEKIRKILLSKRDWGKLDFLEEAKKDIKDIVGGKKDMKFDIIVGNPPYNTPKNKTNNEMRSIYDNFMDIAHHISNNTILITPARFLFKAKHTKGYCEWVKNILDNEHFRVLQYNANGSDVFENNVEIKGGVAIHQYNVNTKYTKIKQFIPNSKLQNIYNKVIKKDFVSIYDNVYGYTKFNKQILLTDYPEITVPLEKKDYLKSNCFSYPCFTDNIANNTIQILGLINNKRHYKYINKKYINIKNTNILNYKVIVPSSNGSGTLGEKFSTPVIGKPVIGKPASGYTQTFISIGNFQSKQEAKNCMNYIKSKFVRAMIGILKVTQSGGKATWKYVPLQDFTNNSDIDWSKSIPEIDKQLYKKYNLSKEEIDFIEKNIQPME